MPQSQSRSRLGLFNHRLRGRSPGVSENEDDEQYEIEGTEREAEVKTVDHKANDLVRLALSTEYRRTPLKREEMVKKVFSAHVAKVDFEPVLERAQEVLRRTFGMELHEIMSRAERDRVDAERDSMQAHDGEANVVGIKKKVSTASSKQYILRSLFNNTIIEMASRFDTDIEGAERADAALWGRDDENRRPEGTLLSWRHPNSDQLMMTGILHVLLALILVNGRVLADMQLRTYMKRLRLPMGSVLPSNVTSQTVKPTTIDAYLVQLVKQSYLDKQKTSLASAQSGQKRVRGGGVVGGAEDGDTSFEWRWGIRAFAEIGEEGVGGFVVDFMDGIERERDSLRMEGASVRGNGRIERDRMQKRKERLITAIGRASGSRIIPYK